MIKKISLFILLAIVFSTLSTHANDKKSKTNKIDTPFNYKLKATKVSDNVWCFLGALEGPSEKNAGNIVNTCYIRTSDSYVLVDSGPSYQYAKQAYKVMSKIKKLPVKTVILTHNHDDHWLGNSFYKETFNAELIGPEYINTHYKEGDKTRMFNLLPHNAIEGTKIIKIDKTPEDVLKLSIGGEEFEIIAIGIKAHTPEDYFVYMPKRKVLFAGGLVMNGRITSNRHGSVIGQIKAIEMIKSKKYEILIPGHGFDTRKTAIDDTEKYFTLLYERVLKALENEVESAELSKIITMSEFKEKVMFSELNGQNVEEAFSEIQFIEE